MAEFFFNGKPVKGIVSAQFNTSKGPISWLTDQAHVVGESETYTMGMLPDGRSVLWVNEGGVPEPTGSDDVTVSLADDATWYAFRDLLHIDPVSLEGV